ncbi:hypothetical protein PATA110616_18805 [Paenibacillus tarimensis]
MLGARIMFILSAIFLGLYTLNINIGITNSTLYALFMAGFCLAFVFTLVGKRTKETLLIRWLSAVTVGLFMLYPLLVGLIWSAADKP